MPYMPVGVDLTYIPNWNGVHPDRHPRWIAMDARRRQGHAMSFGSIPGYREYGQGMTLDELNKACEEMGLPPSYVNVNLNRIVVGDLMLAYIPMDEWKRREKERVDAVRTRDENEMTAYVEGTTRNGVRAVVYESEEHLNDVKSFNGRTGHERVGYRPSR